MENQEDRDYLGIFDALPDLLAMASAQIKLPGNIYEVQDTLREQYRAKGLPFKWSMPMRHMYGCGLCEHQAGEIRYKLENPPARDKDAGAHQATIDESEIHRAREHGWALPEECRRFLAEVSSYL